LTNEKEKAVGMTAEKREELIVSTLPLIKHIAHKVMMRLPATIEMHDLVNAGVLGLLDAVDKFEPERGVKFKTYAEVRIRGTILDSLRDLDWAPRSLRKKSKDLERVYVELGQKLGRPATDEEASAALGGNLEEFHALVKGEGKINYYPDDGTNDPYIRFETNELTSILGEAIDSLPERERLVLSLYYYEEFTMKEIGTLLGVNESRVSQIHTKATIRLRTKLGKLGPNLDRAVEMINR
jgi:RNA polymerase sigma factor for flagellar operon FliA